jgi:hypothetical protein
MNTSVAATSCPSSLDQLALPVKKVIKLNVFMKHGVVISTHIERTSSKLATLTGYVGFQSFQAIALNRPKNK